MPTLKSPSKPTRAKQESGKGLSVQRLVLCEFISNGRMVKRWVKPHHVVNAKRGCGCLDWMYAREAGEGECLDCFACKEENRFALTP